MICKYCGRDNPSISVYCGQCGSVVNEYPLHPFSISGDCLTGYREDPSPPEAILVIPTGVRTISGGAFKNYSCLRSVTVPSGVTDIHNGAFANCTFLQTVNLPETVSHIGSGAFDGCKQLSSVNLPGGADEPGLRGLPRM